MAGSQQTFVDETLNGVLCIVAVSRQVLSDSFATPWTVAYQAPPSMGFSRQEYWRGLPFSSPGNLPGPGIELRSSTLQADSLPFEPRGNPHFAWMHTISLYRYTTTYLSVQDFMEVWIISLFLPLFAALNIYVQFV